jgi:hypothetical protein
VDDDEDLFAAALAELEPSGATGEVVARADASSGVGLLVGVGALLVGTVLAVVLAVGLMPTGWRVPAAGFGYVLTPATVMATRVVVHLRMLRAQRAGATVPRAIEQRLRRLHRAAVASLIVAVAHVWVLAQAANVWANVWWGAR